MEAAARKKKARVLEREATTKEMKATALEMEAASEKMKARALKMEAASEEMKAKSLEMEAATEKMKATPLEMEAASEEMKATPFDMESAAAMKRKATVLELEAATKKMKATALKMEAASEKMKATALEMETASEKMKATALEREAATEKMKSSVLDIEAAPKKIANICTLTVNILLYIFRFLRTEDRIASAHSCDRFRRFCMDEGVFRKLDLSSCVMSTLQRCVVNKFFRDSRSTENIRELNISNLRVLNWQMHDHLEEFIVSICPQLEALHVVNCGVSLQALQRILQLASQLTALSWSTWDFTSEDIEFLLKTMKSTEGICFKNIKHLHLHMNYSSLPQIQIAKYLVLSCCRDLEELKIYTWGIPEKYCTRGSFPLASNRSIPGFRQPSVHNELNNLHSLVMVTVGGIMYNKELHDFIVSVLSRKSSSTKWKKFWISPTKGSISREQLSRLLLRVHSDDFHSLEAFGADLRWSDDAGDEMKTLFEGIGDNTVRRLQLCLPVDSD